MEPLDRPALRELCANDDALVREVLEVFERELQRLFGDVRDAVTAGDAEAIRRSAHRLKGALTAVVARPATACAHALEVGGPAGAHERLEALEHEVQMLTAALAPRP